MYIIFSTTDVTFHSICLVYVQPEQPNQECDTKMPDIVKHEQSRMIKQTVLMGQVVSPGYQIANMCVYEGRYYIESDWLCRHLVRDCQINCQINNPACSMSEKVCSFTLYDKSHTHILASKTR